MEFVEILCPERKQLLLKFLPYFACNHVRIEAFSAGVNSNQQKKQQLSIFDDSSNFAGIVKLGIFILGVFQNFDIFEHFLGLVPIQNTRTSKCILEDIVAMH